MHECMYIGVRMLILMYPNASMHAVTVHCMLCLNIASSEILVFAYGKISAEIGCRNRLQ